MIVLVDLRYPAPDVSVIEEDLPGVSVEVHGSDNRLDVDFALAEAGAGRAPGHHAELAVGWLELQEAALRPTEPVGRWLEESRLDATRSRLAAPIRWEDQKPEGCSHLARGVVEHGDARGRLLGFPTANISLTDSRVEDGVWAGWLYREHGPGQVAAISVGTRPTFYGTAATRLLEAYLLDFDEDIYDEIVLIVLRQRIRGQRRYADADSLCEQLRSDVTLVRRWHQELAHASAGTTSRTEAQSAHPFRGGPPFLSA
jgi:predicted amidophosphoribosyltransferase